MDNHAGRRKTQQKHSSCLRPSSFGLFHFRRFRSPSVFVPPLVLFIHLFLFLSYLVSYSVFDYRSVLTRIIHNLTFTVMLYSQGLKCVYNFHTCPKYSVRCITQESVCLRLYIWEWLHAVHMLMFFYVHACVRFYSNASVAACVYSCDQPIDRHMPLGKGCWRCPAGLGTSDLFTWHHVGSLC